MSETEKNRQVVQDGLNKRKARRKKAEEEAYQDSIERQMINVVNNKYAAREAEEQECKANELKQAEIERETRIHNKKIASIQEKRNGAIAGIFMSLMLFAMVGICYVTETAELKYIIAATVLTTIMFIISAYFAVSNAIKLTQEVSHARIIA